MIPTDVIDTAQEAAGIARSVTLRHFRSDIQIDSKSDQTPVTIADKKTEQAIKEFILNKHPTHSFIGEESGATGENSEWQWVIDPIDGTKSFATGCPTFGTLIALLHLGKPVLGIVDHPALEEQWVGMVGHETRKNRRLCSTSTTTVLDSASIYATTIDMFNTEEFNRYDTLSKACQFRVFGGDCYCYGLLSSGYTDIVCESDLKPYDVFALIPVVEGAGGIITDWQGQPFGHNSNGQVLATANEALHSAALEILNA